jgi:hypothetical protein
LLLLLPPLSSSDAVAVPRMLSAAKLLLSKCSQVAPLLVLLLLEK